MEDNARKAELARFLRTRRSMIQPETVGLAGGPRRRTPGLRREEVAALAQVGLAWYTWLEQSRDIQVSKEVIERIAKALRLSHSDTAYFRSLAGKEIAKTEQGGGEELRDVQRLLDGFTAGPAMLWNERFDCIAFNHLADVIYDWSESPSPFGRNLAWRNFMDPARRGFYDERVLRSGVGLLRVRYAKHIGEPGFESLIATLLESNTTFRHFWNEQQTASLDPLSFEIAHSQFGTLRLRSIRALYPALPESTLAFVTPDNKATEDVFRKIDSLGRRRRN